MTELEVCPSSFCRRYSEPIEVTWLAESTRLRLVEKRNDSPRRDDLGPGTPGDSALQAKASWICLEAFIWNAAIFLIAKFVFR
jgi:hypothetical protein